MFLNSRTLSPDNPALTFTLKHHSHIKKKHTNKLAMLKFYLTNNEEEEKL